MTETQDKPAVNVDEDVCIGFADIRKLFDANGRLLPEAEWPPEVAVAVESVEYSDAGYNIQLKPKVEALGRLLNRGGSG